MPSPDSPPLAVRLADLAWPGRPRRWADLPHRLRPTLLQVVRLTTAAVIAYLLTVAWTDGPLDLTGALTALLVVQATSFSTLRMGIVRVGAVVTGVLVAVGLTTMVGLTWWSLALAISASLILAKVLRLGDQALETPISAMLILGVHGQDVAVETRIVTTLIGTCVGIVFTLLFPPSVPSVPAAVSVRRVATETGALLRRVAGSMRERPVQASEADGWLDTARGLNSFVAQASEQVIQVKDSRRLNPRAIGTTSAEPVLRTGLDTLERTAFAVRSMFTVVQREVPEEGNADDVYSAEVRAAFATVLDTMAGCVEDFGELIEAEVHGREREVEERLLTTLDSLREARAILTELMFVDGREHPGLWLLRGSVLSAVEQVVVQLEVEERDRVRRELAAQRRLRAGVRMVPDQITWIRR